MAVCLVTYIPKPIGRKVYCKYNAMLQLILQRQDLQNASMNTYYIYICIVLTHRKPGEVVSLESFSDRLEN